MASEAPSFFLFPPCWLQLVEQMSRTPLHEYVQANLYHRCAVADRTAHKSRTERALALSYPTVYAIANRRQHEGEQSRWMMSL